jgi:hypothetical protein
MRLIQHLLKRYGFELNRIYRETQPRTFSSLDEQSRIKEFTQSLENRKSWCVDIGAGDGVKGSNTFALFRDGWKGLAVEYDPQRFAMLARTYASLEVDLAKCKVTPNSIVPLLQAHHVPTDFDVLSLDIDGYDYFVLEQFLDKFRPSVICTEINEKIPPPIKFAVRYDPHYSWAGDHFYGQSISLLHQLCSTQNYSLVELHYNNAFLIPNELNTFPALTAEEAYARGYREKRDRSDKFPWNANMEALLTLPPSQGLSFVADLFEKYSGQFICTL